MVSEGVGTDLSDRDVDCLLRNTKALLTAVRAGVAELSQSVEVLEQIIIELEKKRVEENNGR